MKDKIVFENLIDSSTGQPVEIDMSSIHPKDRKTLRLDMQHIAACGTDTIRTLNKMLNAKDFKDAVKKLENK